jgi:glutathione synthase/RimK-type ligase-like ATP-grasp enzyme
MPGGGVAGTVGILATSRAAPPGFCSEAFYRELCTVGQRLGLDVYVFTPQGLGGYSQGGRAYVRCYRPDPDGKGWRQETAPLPEVVYDRHFASSAAELARYRTALRRLAAQEPAVPLLGGGLPGKLAVQRMLARDPALAPHLPPTAPLRSAGGLLAALERSGELFLKPDGGSQGRGAFRASAVAGGVVVRGRTPRNETFARRFARADDFAAWLMAAVGSRSYLIQPYLPLVDREGAAYDIRCLMQKDGSGRWQATGFAARRGKAGSVTANLHGGGAAEPARTLLEREFGAAEAERIGQTLKHIAERVPLVLEEQHGRLCELGIDFGVASGGSVWLIEVNSKPGRAAFARLGSQELRQASVENPLRYARALLRSPSMRRALPSGHR